VSGQVGRRGVSVVGVWMRREVKGKKRKRCSRKMKKVGAEHHSLNFPLFRKLREKGRTV
jgi:hypothetical protein